MEDEKQCRVCLEHNNIRDLIAPCKCSGTMRYIHRMCLNRWRFTSPNVHDAIECNQCKFTYILKEYNYYKFWDYLKGFNIWLSKSLILMNVINVITFFAIWSCINILQEDYQGNFLTIFGIPFNYNYICSVYIYISSLFFLILLTFSLQINPLSYFKYLFEKTENIFLFIMLFVSLFLFFLSTIITLTFSTLFFKIFIKQHYKAAKIVEIFELVEVRNLDGIDITELENDDEERIDTNEWSRLIHI